MKSEKSVELIIGALILLGICAILFSLHTIPTEITIQSSGFDPNYTSTYTGPVTWTNNDNKTHHVVSDSGLFDSGDLNPGQSYTYDFSWHDFGNYHYHDSINTSIKGRIQVEMISGGG